MKDPSKMCSQSLEVWDLKRAQKPQIITLVFWLDPNNLVRQGLVQNYSMVFIFK